MKHKRSLVQIGVCMFLVLTVFCSCKRSSSNPFNYDYLPVQMSKDASWSIIDKDGNEVVKEEYPADAEVSLIRDGVYWVKSNGKCQLFSIDSPKKPLTDEEFTKVTLFNAGAAFVSNPNQQIRIIGTDGKTVVTLPKSIKKCWALSESGYAVFQDADNKAGIIDSKGNIVVPAAYSDMMVESPEGLTLAKKSESDKKWIIINMKGEKLGEIDTEKYHLLNSTIHEGKIIVRDESNEDGPSIVLDKTGKKLFEIRKAREKYWCSSFLDGFLTFENADEKYGIVNEDGEEVIRAKYESLINLGNGEFAAKKGDKWGVINDKDETILDFEYENSGAKMGDNYLFKDGSGWVLVGKDKKEITSCHNVSTGAANKYAEFVDIDGLANQFVKQIEEFEQPESAKETAEKAGIKNHYEWKINRTMTIDDKLNALIVFWFRNCIAHEMSHQEQVNDGWFTYNRTVSDGWQWSDEKPYYIVGTWDFSDKSFDVDAFHSAVVEKLLQTHKKLSNGEYSKNVTISGVKKECRVSLTPKPNAITMSVEFKK